MVTITIYTFETAGALGRLGPTQEQLNKFYKTSLPEANIQSSKGIQLWTVPKSGMYKIEAYGAQGGNSSLAQGGKGAIMTGELNLVQGEVLKILIGQQGENSLNGGGGGGGTSVARSTTILVLAGGGGGGSSYGNKIKNGLNGNISKKVEGVASSLTGTGGATGGGYNTNGNIVYEQPTAAISYLRGGLGGTGYKNLGSGGFGSGGGSGFSAGGGGGGYSGGYGGGNGSITVASGGTSINAGANQANSVGNTGDGKVIIKYLGE